MRVERDDQKDVQRVSGNITRNEAELTEDYGAEIV